MIKQIEIKNFRNIKHAVYALDKTAIIAGQNGLGKSNTLNAINWLLTDTLLTDHYGKGENDIMSIIPTDHQKGQHTEVSIWLDTDTKFTKYYKRTYNRAGTKVNGHKSEFSINDVACDNANTFYSELYGALSYYPTFNSVRISENRLFTDPLFALQKLDAKELRNLLVALGCSVTNEELYELGYEHMRQYEAKFLGKWDVMRKNLKDNKSKLEKQKTDLEAQLEEYAGAEEFNLSELEELLAKRDDLMFRKKNITAGDNDYRIRELSSEIQLAKQELKNKITVATGEIELAIQSAKIKRQAAEDKLKLLKSNATQDLETKKQLSLQNIHSIEITIKSLTDMLNRTNSDIEETKNKARKNQSDKNDAAVKLNLVMSSSYKNYLTCPHCGESFPASEEDYKRYETNKRDEIASIKNKIAGYNSSNEKLKEEYETLKIKHDNAQNELSKANDNLSKEKELLAYFNRQIADAANIQYDTSEIDTMTAKIISLEEQLKTVPNKFNEENIKIINLENEKTQLELGNTESINIQILKFEEELLPIENKIEKLYVDKSNWEKKLSKEKQIQAVQKELNDNDFLLAQVNEFIQTMIQKINDKATEKTGINFVMLEENITNENISEVCYAKVDGVPFKDLNTSRKIEVGIKFIERCKLIASNDFGSTWNNLPILADRLEGVDSVDKIRNLTTEQLICTRVSTEDVITIL